MQDMVINAHRLIGETIREPGEERRGRIVGVDQSRAVPVIFVIWHGQEGIQRIELAFDELRQLAEACSQRQANPPEQHDIPEGLVSEDVESPASPALPRRRVGSR